jgi:hypothetical protein
VTFPPHLLLASLQVGTLYPRVCIATQVSKQPDEEVLHKAVGTCIALPDTRLPALLLGLSVTLSGWKPGGQGLAIVRLLN